MVCQLKDEVGGRATMKLSEWDYKRRRQPPRSSLSAAAAAVGERNDANGDATGGGSSSSGGDGAAVHFEHLKRLFSPKWWPTTSVVPWDGE
jgi:hypothetical protein